MDLEPTSGKLRGIIDLLYNRANGGSRVQATWRGGLPDSYNFGWMTYASGQTLKVRWADNQWVVAY